MTPITHGFFGKLPNVGDFVGRGWTAECRNALDLLLREALAEAIATQDPKHPFEHDVSFAISIAPGVVCADGLLVVVVPSQDRVGRRFPLAMGVHVTARGPSPSSGWPSNDYVKALVMSARRQLVVGLDTELLQLAVTRVGDPTAYEPLFSGASDGDALRQAAARPSLVFLPGPMDALTPAQAGFCAACGDSDALGYRIDAAAEACGFFVVRRLDGGRPLAAVFDGRWSERNWVTLGASTAANSDDSGDATLDADATQPHDVFIDTSEPGRDSLSRFRPRSRQ